MGILTESGIALSQKRSPGVPDEKHNSYTVWKLTAIPRERGDQYIFHGYLVDVAGPWGNRRCEESQFKVILRALGTFKRGHLRQSRLSLVPCETLRRVPEQWTSIPQVRQFLRSVLGVDLVKRDGISLGVYALEDKVVDDGPDYTKGAQHPERDAKSDGIRGRLLLDVDIGTDNLEGGVSSPHCVDIRGELLTPPSCEKEIMAPMPTARFMEPAQFRAIQAVAAGEIGYMPAVARKTPNTFRVSLSGSSYFKSQHRPLTSQTGQVVISCAHDHNDKSAAGWLDRGQCEAGQGAATYHAASKFGKTTESILCLYRSAAQPERTVTIEAKM